MKPIYLLATSIVLVFASCKNKYERDLVGKYEATVANGLNIGNKKWTIFLELTMKKKFALNFDTTNISGSWEAGDNGDFTWLNLKSPDKIIECRVTGKKSDEIEVLIPSLISDLKIGEIKFYKTSK